jgi:hypothetical protein
MIADPVLASAEVCRFDEQTVSEGRLEAASGLTKIPECPNYSTELEKVL